MKTRILILGKTGMLGHVVECVLVADGRFVVRGVGRAEFDAEGDPRVLVSLLADADYVINCIGMTARHINDAHPESVARAICVNAEFPHTLATAAATCGVRVIHVSTDGVFSGNAPEPCDEGSVPDATDTYGRTKILGESRAPNVLNIRTSIIGPSPMKREGLWEWIASQPNGAIVDGYTNHLWHGVTTVQFAELCRRIIAADRFDVFRTGGHAFHFVPNVPISKAELVVAIAATVGRRITVRPVAHSQPVHRVLATRPDIANVFSASQSLAEVLRVCAMAMT